MEAGSSSLPTLKLKGIVDSAEFLPLAAAVVQSTNDMGLLGRLQTAKAHSSRANEFPSALIEEVRTTALGLLVSQYDLPVEFDRDTTPSELLQALVSIISGVTTNEAARYLPMMLDQAGFQTPEQRFRHSATQNNDSELTVAVVGAGMSGICAAIELKRAGFRFQVFERNDSVGGTWHENKYPGCGVDTPSIFYSYSFESSYPWRHYFAKRDQIAQYFEHCVDKYEVRSNIVLSTEVVRASYDEVRQRWELVIKTSGEREHKVYADALIAAVGQLNIPSIPSLPGMDSFRGPIVHTASWPKDLDVKGKRVGLVGTGASGMQVGPAIAGSVEHLTVFQREPHWILPNAQYHAELRDDEHWLFKHMPYYAQWVRAQLIWNYGDAVYPSLQVDRNWESDGGSINAVSESFRKNMMRHIQRELTGRPDLIAKTTPNYPPYAKRVLLDNHWYKMLRNDNVDLVTSSISRISENRIQTADGHIHALDVLVLATGFQATRMLSSVDIHGRNDIRLRDAWEGDNPRAYLGITVPDFPNLFLLYGPNTNLGYGGSAIFNSECQVRYAVQCLQLMKKNGWGSLECRRETHDSYNQEVDAMHADMVWARQDVDNWYRNSQGRVATNSPWRLMDYWHLTHTPNPDDFLIEFKRSLRLVSTETGQ